MNRARIILVTGVLLLLLAIMILPEFLIQQDIQQTITVGGKDFTEQSILGEIMAIMIENHLEVYVDRKLYLGGTMICFNALSAGDLDLYAEYTGTGLVSILNESADNPEKVYENVKKQFRQQYNMVWLEPFGFNNTYTLTMRKQQAQRLGIETVTDLARHLQRKNTVELRAGFNAEFLERPDGYAGLIEAYNIDFKNTPKQMDSGLMYKACADGDVDVICAFATDGRIAAYDLVTLVDDRRFFPPYQAAPLIRVQTLAKYPALQEVLNRLGGRIDNETMQKLNYQVDRQTNAKTAYQAAYDFLVSQQLINNAQSNASQKE